MSVLKSFDLTGKVALVTGCSQGIGFGLATALAQAGADIIGVSRSLSQDGKLAGNIAALERRFNAYQCDFSDRSDLKSFIKTVQKNHSQIDILVNNAGTIRRSPALDHVDEDWDFIIDLDLSSQFILTREIGRQMVKRGYGKIVFTASLMSFQGGLNHPSYVAAKGGISQLVKALANEWAGRGVNVNAIAPGYIHTSQTQILREDTKRGAEIMTRMPAGRWGTPEDLAGALVLLSSSASDYISGTTLVVDGGWLGR